MSKYIIDGEMTFATTNAASAIIYTDANGNNSTLQDELNRINNLLNNLHPIGSIYMTTSDDNPSDLFGGIWEKIKDRFLLASGNSYQNGHTGGEVTHTLTVDEMANHNHTHRQYIFSGVASNGTKYGFSYSTSAGRCYDRDSYSDSGEFMFGNYPTGGSQEHNNMPPYLTVNTWKRIG